MPYGPGVNPARHSQSPSLPNNCKTMFAYILHPCPTAARRCLLIFCHPCPKDDVCLCSAISLQHSLFPVNALATHNQHECLQNGATLILFRAGEFSCIHGIPGYTVVTWCAACTALRMPYTDLANLLPTNPYKSQIKHCAQNLLRPGFRCWYHCNCTHAMHCHTHARTGKTRSQLYIVWCVRCL